MLAAENSCALFAEVFLGYVTGGRRTRTNFRAMEIKGKKDGSIRSTLYLTSTESRRSHQGERQLTINRWLSNTFYIWSDPREKIKWTRKAGARTAKLQVAHEACLAIFWPTPGVIMSTFDSSEFPAEEDLNFCDHGTVSRDTLFKFWKPSSIGRVYVP